MNTIFGRILSQSGAYAVGNMMLKLGGLLVLPLYVNHLSAEFFGYFSLLDVTARILALIGGLGLSTGLLRFYARRDTYEDPEAIPFTTLVLTGLAAVVILPLLWVTAPFLAQALLDDAARAPLVRWMSLFVALKILQGIPLIYLRAQERAVPYVLATVAEMLLLVGCVYGLLIVAERGLRGIMEAYVISAGLTTLMLMAWILAQVPWRFHTGLAGPLLRFGLPLVLASLSSLFLSFGDRYLLKLLTDPETVGVYDWSARIGGTLNMLFVNSFQMAFGIIGLKALSEMGASAVATYRRTFKHYVIWTGWGVVGVSLLALDFTAWIANKPAYLAADDLVFPIALGYLALGIYVIAFNVVLIQGDSPYIAFLVFLAAGANAVLNLILIPVIGALGAAVATGLAYALQMALMAYRAQNDLQARFPWHRLVHVLVLVAGLYAVGKLTTSWEPARRLPVRLGLIAAYPPLVILTGLYTRAEVRKGWNWLHTWWQGRRSKA